MDDCYFDMAVEMQARMRKAIERIELEHALGLVYLFLECSSFSFSLDNDGLYNSCFQHRLIGRTDLNAMYSVY